MDKRNNSGSQMSVADIFTWKPPTPTIDINDINEIEKFLYGEEFIQKLDANQSVDSIFNHENSDSTFSSTLEFLESGCTLTSDEELTMDAETEDRLEALLEAAGVGKLSMADGKTFADPQVQQRLSSSVTCALDEATAALNKIRCKKELFEKKKNESSSRTTPDPGACNVEDVNHSRKLLCEGRSSGAKTDGGLLSLACSLGHYELAEVLLSVPPYVDETTYLTDGRSQELKNKINHTFLSTLNQQLTKALISLHANVDDRSGDESGSTPLMRAASAGFCDIVRLLISHGTDVNAASDAGNTALTCASSGGFDKVVQVLLEHGAELEHLNERGRTALMEAAAWGHVLVVEVLLKHGATIHTLSLEYKETALTIASFKGHFEMVRFLLHSGTDHNADELYTALMEASVDGHVEVATLLLEAGALANHSDAFEPSLALAVCGGHVVLAELLIEKGVRLDGVNDQGYTPLMEAARQGQLAIVKLFIEKGADVNIVSEMRETALTLAAAGGCVACVRALADADADLEIGSPTPLMEAVHENHLEVVEFLCDKGVNVNTVDPIRGTPLLLACTFGHLNVADCLISKGSNVDHRGNGDLTPLMKAAAAGHVSTVQLLLNRGANVNAVTSDSEHSVLSLACRSGSCDVIELLVSHGADPFQQLKDGSTMLHEAIKGGHVNVVRLLLQLCQPTSASLQASPFPQQTHRSPTCSLPAPSLSHVKTCSLSSSTQIPHDRVVDNDVSSNELSPSKLDTDPPENPSSESTNTMAALLARLAHDDQSTSAGDVTSTYDALLRLFHDKATGSATPRVESLVGKAEVRLKDIEEKIKNLIEGEVRLNFDEASSNSEAASRRAKALCSAREVQMNKKRRILEELRKVNGELQLETRMYQGTFTRHSTEPSQAATGNTSGASHLSTTANHSTRRYKSRLVDEKQPVPSVIITPHAVSPSAHSQINNVTEDNRDSPLSLASARGRSDLVHLLLSRGAMVDHVNRTGLTPLLIAASGGHASVVSTLLDANADIETLADRTQDTSLSLASSNGAIEVVDVLLRRGANVEHRNVSDYTPLSLAASGGFDNVVELLIRHGAEINSRSASKLGISPLMMASMSGHVSTVRLLLDKGADVNAQMEVNRNSPLTLACFQGWREVVRVLVERKANLEHRAKSGLTPLMEAASGGYPEVGRILLDHGADPNASSSRDTALTIAADKGHHTFCVLLLTRNATIDFRNKKGCTALWLSSNGGHLDIVRHLVANGADVMAADNRNVSPLLAAVRNGYVEVVCCLLEKVNQFPSVSECLRFAPSSSDQELLERVHQCINCVLEAKDFQEKQANKLASKLLEELDKERNQEEDRREKAAKKREKRRKKKKQKFERSESNVENPAADERKSEKDREVTRDDDPDDDAEVVEIPLSASVAVHSDRSATISDGKKEERTVAFPQQPSCHSNVCAKTEERREETVAKTAQGNCESESKSSQGEQLKRDEALNLKSTNQRSVTKRPLWREEDWREVTKKNGVVTGIKRLVVASSLIPRLIGVAGCNVNAIRLCTGAQIDIEKLKKGAQERTVTIKGTADAIYRARGLIAGLIDDDTCCPDLSRLVNKSPNRTSCIAVSQSPLTTVSRTLVAAPLPSNPAWISPPSIVTQSPTQKKTGAVTSSSLLTSSPEMNTSSSSLLTCTVVTVASSSTSSAIGRVLPALLPRSTASQGVSPLVSLTPDTSNKPKPIQPVAPIMSCKSTSSSAPELPRHPGLLPSTLQTKKPFSSRTSGCNLLPPVPSSDRSTIMSVTQNALSLSNQIKPSHRHQEYLTSIASSFLICNEPISVEGRNDDRIVTPLPARYGIDNFRGLYNGISEEASTSSFLPLHSWNVADSTTITCVNNSPQTCFHPGSIPNTFAASSFSPGSTSMQARPKRSMPKPIGTERAYRRALSDMSLPLDGAAHVQRLSKTLTSQSKIRHEQFASFRVPFSACRDDVFTTSEKEIGGLRAPGTEVDIRDNATSGIFPGCDGFSERRRQLASCPLHLFTNVSKCSGSQRFTNPLPPLSATSGFPFHPQPPLPSVVNHQLQGRHLQQKTRTQAPHQYTPLLGPTAPYLQFPHQVERDNSVDPEEEFIRSQQLEEDYRAWRNTKWPLSSVRYPNEKFHSFSEQVAPSPDFTAGSIPYCDDGGLRGDPLEYHRLLREDHCSSDRRWVAHNSLANHSSNPDFNCNFAQPSWPTTYSNLDGRATSCLPHGTQRKHSADGLLQQNWKLY